MSRLLSNQQSGQYLKKSFEKSGRYAVSYQKLHNFYRLNFNFDGVYGLRLIKKIAHIRFARKCGARITSYATDSTTNCADKLDTKRRSG